MWISSLKLKNVKGFSETDQINLSKTINVLIGPNNSGKSTVIKSLYVLQNVGSLNNSSIRIGRNDLEVQIGFKDPEQQYLGMDPNEFDNGNWYPLITFHLHDNGVNTTSVANRNGSRRDVKMSPPLEPRNFIYPYLSKRKVTTYDQVINSNNATAVSENLTHLYSKIDRLNSPDYPAHGEYQKACDEILGFTVSAYASPGGKQAGLIVNNFKSISIESMGDGVINLLGIIVDLCVAEGKLFLIEELENDIHPKALKSLLELIIQKSQKNQFVISTHSNIVTKYLGAQPGSKIFNVNMFVENRMPNSEITEIGDLPEERRAVLEELGYEMYDYDLWRAWLFLEESSAERIIRDYLIPWFVPTLKEKMRTFSARSIEEVELKFADFDRLFVFVHLENMYKNKAWVLVDNGERGKKVIQSLQEKYVRAEWDESRFSTFLQNDFEKYYPAEFQDEVDKALATNHQEKREAKKKVLENLLRWIEENQEKAKIEFAKSASEIIAILKQIEAAL